VPRENRSPRTFKVLRTVSGPKCSLTWGISRPPAHAVRRGTRGRARISHRSHADERPATGGGLHCRGGCPLSADGHTRNCFVGAHAGGERARSPMAGPMPEGAATPLECGRGGGWCGGGGGVAAVARCGVLERVDGSGGRSPLSRRAWWPAGVRPSPLLAFLRATRASTGLCRGARAPSRLRKEAGRAQGPARHPRGNLDSDTASGAGVAPPRVPIRAGHTHPPGGRAGPRGAARVCDD